MNRSRPSYGLAIPAAAVVLALVAITAFVAGGAAGRDGSTPPATPSASPSPSATPKPTPKPTPVPTPAPSDDLSDGRIEVDLDTVIDDDVSVAIDDETGKLIGARSGRAGDGMSTRWYEMKVENLDDSTLRLVWVGLPGDREARLGISTVDGKLRLRMVDQGPPLMSDDLGYDRVLVLEFDEPVDAADVLPSVQGGLDTAD